MRCENSFNESIHSQLNFHCCNSLASLISISEATCCFPADILFLWYFSVVFSQHFAVVAFSFCHSQEEAGLFLIKFQTSMSAT